MTKRSLGPKSSASQLWDALQKAQADAARYRRLASATDKPGGLATGEVVVSQEDLDALRRDADSSDARARALAKELSDARTEAAETGAAGETFAGKPALVDLMRAWRRFSTAVKNLPAVRERYGPDAVRLAVASRLIPNLYLLGLTAPRSESEAHDRDRVRRMLDHPVLLALLCRSEPWGARARVAFLSLAARCFLRPTYYAVYDKSAERGDADSLGTVYK